MFVRYFFIFVFAVGFASVSPTPVSQPVTESSADSNPIYDQDYPWVDSLMNTMTVDEKIGQLFMVAAYSNKDAANESQIEQLIKKYRIGGLIFMQGGPVRQVRLTNTYQSVSKIPLLIGMDAEWGPAMRIDSVMAFQRQLTWGAVRDDSVIYKAGKTIAQELKRLGVQVNFAPDIDINNNPANPVIGDRSFGEDKLNVALKGLAYMNGLQDEHILACGKHFPGHGDVNQDSHLTLPLIKHSWERLDSVELVPFRILVNQGLGAVMLAHLSIPSLDDTPNLASSLSPKVGRTLLRDSLHFKGLVFSDALNMKGVADYYQPGELEVKAFLAGNDVLLFSQNVPVAFAAIKKAVADSVITMKDLDASVERILKAKAFTGLNHYTPAHVVNLAFDINTTDAALLKRTITEKSLTLVNRADSLLPFRTLDTLQLASVSIGSTVKTTFQTYLAKYAKCYDYHISRNADAATWTDKINKLSGNDVVIIGIHDLSKSADKNFGVSAAEIDFVKKLSARTKVIVVIFGTPYATGQFSSAQYQVVAYDNSDYAQQAAAMALFGAIPFEGKLPVGSGVFKVNQGITTENLDRLKYSIPEETGIATADLSGIDSIAQACIKNQAAPGCQVLVAKDGKVIWDKSYGNFTYSPGQQVDYYDLYDLASCTKICATTPALMKLYDEGKFDLSKKVSDYLPDTKNSAIENITMTDLLTHQAGLVGWIPFYKNTLNADGTLNSLYYNQTEIKGFNVKVADGVYMRNSYQDSIWEIIKRTPLKEKHKYVYSDLTMYISRRIAESLEGERIDAYMEHKFYAPLGMQYTCYNPLTKFAKDQIAPTEKDNYFRYQLVQGYVHDMGAAMMGGVEGHAGLFSNAENLAILFQMMLNGGEYGGTRYLNPGTIAQWTTKNSNISRRGLGFDKSDPGGNSPCSDYASGLTYGHQGFTGTCIWVDPKYKLIYIFLSNRVYPISEPNKLASQGIRNKIMDVIYESFLNKNQSSSPASD